MIDCSRPRFVDLTGVRAASSAQRRARRAGRELHDEPFGDAGRLFDIARRHCTTSAVWSG